MIVNIIKNIARRMHKKAAAHIRIGLKEIGNKFVRSRLNIVEILPFIDTVKI